MRTMATQAPEVNLVTPSMTNTMPGLSGVSAALVVSIGGKSPSRPATGTNHVNRAGRNSLAFGYSPRAGSTGNACRHTRGAADT